MRIHHHPHEATLLAYAAGAFTEGFSFVLAAHMEYCPRCRSRVAEAEALGGGLLAELPPLEMTAGGISNVWARIAAKSAVEPPPAPRPVPGGAIPASLTPFLRGDLADLDASVHHQPVADTHEPCVCLIATDERLRFSGAFSRMLQPLIGI